MYGLNNNLKSANNTNNTQNSAKANKNLKLAENALDIKSILDGLKYGKSGGDRVKGIVNAILSFKGKS